MNPKYIQLKSGEVVQKIIDDDSNWALKMSGTAYKDTVGKIVGTNVVYGTFFVTNLRLIFESNDGRIVDEFLHETVIKTSGKNGTAFTTSQFDIFTDYNSSSQYILKSARSVSDYLNNNYYSHSAKKNLAKFLGTEREKHLDYNGAIDIYEKYNLPEEAARVRRNMYDEKKVEQTVVHGDYVDDRETIVKDSVINRSNIGAGGDDKFARLERLAEMKEKGLIDDDEFKQMKKEILGK
tara:strand:+ start:309 stop:1019 length:711 start_codon:yes stop_codon:yes gene_type:complete